MRRILYTQTVCSAADAYLAWTSKCHKINSNTADVLTKRSTFAEHRAQTTELQ